MSFADYSKEFKDESRWHNWDNLPSTVQAQWKAVMTETAWRVHWTVPGNFRGREVIETIYFNPILGERVAILTESGIKIQQTDLLAMLWKPHQGQGWVWQSPTRPATMAQRPLTIGPCGTQNLCIV